MLMSIQDSAGQTFPRTLVLEHVSDEYCRYLKTQRFADDNCDNPFAERYNVSTNVKNGFGIFTFIGRSEVPLP